MLIIAIFQSAWPQLDISPNSYQPYSVIASIDSTLLAAPFLQLQAVFLAYH